MRGSSRLIALVTLLTGIPTVASAEPGSTPTGARAAAVVREFWGIVSDVTQGQRQAEHPRPQPIPQATDERGTVPLTDVSRPLELEQRLREAVEADPEHIKITVPGGAARLGNFSVGSSEVVQGPVLIVRGDAAVYGRLIGNLVTVEGDVIVHPGGLVSGDIVTLGGQVYERGGEIGGEVRSLAATTVFSGPAEAETPPTALELVGRRAAGVLGVFLTLSALGFGLVMFGKPNLEVVSDTVSHSFGRAFVTGLLGQILLLPTFGMLVVGLILSVAGILLLPFAVVVYGLLVVVAGLGGFLAVAHAMGETYTRRRMALGAMIGSPNSYRYLLVGLGALAALWFAWAIFGWVPVAGELMRGAAFLVTWLLATAGFGAALLSRAGVRENFAGRLIPPEALTDEYLWATPQFGVPAGRRPGAGTRTPTRGL